MLEVARNAADADHTPILIQGESGMGKDVLARAIHYSSPRGSQPQLELNCATLPDALLESELFGFEPDAFTDAPGAKRGCSSVLTRNSISRRNRQHIPPACKPNCCLGGTKSIKVDVCLVTATNTNLKEAVSQGRFREDLFYRLNVVPLFIPRCAKEGKTFCRSRSISCRGSTKSSKRPSSDSRRKLPT